MISWDYGSHSLSESAIEISATRDDSDNVVIKAIIKSTIPTGTKIDFKVTYYPDENKTDSFTGTAVTVVIGCSKPTTMTFTSPNAPTYDTNYGP